MAAARPAVPACGDPREWSLGSPAFEARAGGCRLDQGLLDRAERGPCSAPARSRAKDSGGTTTIPRTPKRHVPCRGARPFPRGPFCGRDFAPSGWILGGDRLDDPQGRPRPRQLREFMKPHPAASCHFVIDLNDLDHGSGLWAAALASDRRDAPAFPAAVEFDSGANLYVANSSIGEIVRVDPARGETRLCGVWLGGSRTTRRGSGRLPPLRRARAVPLPAAAGVSAGGIAGKAEGSLGVALHKGWSRNPHWGAQCRASGSTGPDLLDRADPLAPRRPVNAPTHGSRPVVVPTLLHQG
jgi:hypothetical protein